MKKSVTWIVLVVIMAFGQFFVSPAAAQEDGAARVPSIDAVILLDHSNSMSNSDYAENDPNGYRFDATEMFISMCDLNGSRVAVIPFAGNLFDEDSQFVDISSLQTREDKIQALKDMYEENDTRPNTDYGAALCQAMKMIQDRTDKTNIPMIIMLTDGELYISPNSRNSSKDAYAWNSATETFDIIQMKNYDEETAAAQAELAVEKAQEYGVPIYTIALLEEIADNDADRAKKIQEQNAFKSILNEYAVKSNGFFTPINAANVHELPIKFGEIFAEQIDSTLLNGLTPSRIGDNQYEVIIPILNQSVQEANIFIPTMDLIDVHLYNANGKEVTSGSADVYRFTGQTFQLYKIYHPQSTGSWKLKFSLPDSSSDISQMAFSLLYNYNIELLSTLAAGEDGETIIADGTQSFSFGKNETISLATRFYNMDGTLSGDLDLYKVYDSADDPQSAWWTIIGSYSLLDSSGRTLYTGTMENEIDCFSADIDLHSILPDPQGYNKLNSGEYTLVIDAVGAGLHRTETIPIALTNSAPYIADNNDSISLLFTVDDPDQPETQTVQTYSIALDQEITDPDHDKLTYSLSPANADAGRVVTLTLNEDEGTITVQTVKDAATGMFAFGTAEYILHVKDQDVKAFTREFPIIIDVESVANRMIDGLICDTTVDGLDSKQVAPKNSTLTFTMTLRSDPASAAPINPQGQIQNFTGTLKIKNNDNNKVSDPIEMTRTDNGTLTAAYETANKSGAFTAICTYVYGTYAGQSDIQHIAFTIENNPPEVNQTVADQIPKRIAFHPLPGFLGFLEQPTKDEDLQIDLTRLITDPDNETLVYSSPEIGNAKAEDTQTRMSWLREGDIVTLVPEAEGDVILRITATDGDDESVTAVKDIVLIDITAKWTLLGFLAAAALIAIIILILIIHQIRKPYFPRNVEIVFMEGESIFESDRKMLDHTKKEQKFSRYLDMTIADRNGIKMEQADIIRIKPMKKGMGSIKVKWMKPADTIAVELDGVTVGHKYTEWGVDHELVLSPAGSSERVRILLTRTNEEVLQTYQSSFDSTF